MIIILTFILFLIFLLYPWSTLSNHRMYSNNKVHYFAHRGVTTNAQENTIEAFNDAYITGVDGIECDVRYTADKVMVIYHDDSIILGTDEMSIYESSFKEINCTLSERSENTMSRVISLDELLKTLPEKILINIEVKSKQINSDGVEDALINLIERYKLSDRLMVSSFNPFLLRRIKKIEKNIFTGYLLGEDSMYRLANNKYIRVLRYILGTLYCKPDAINPEINYLNSTMNNFIKRYEMALFPYTVNSNIEFEKAISMRANGFFSDNIEFINKCK